MSVPKISQKEPFFVDVQEGEKKAWCSCGYSSKNPFCDGSHAKEKTGMKPVILKMDSTETVAFCGCKHTKNPPYCDGSHNNL